MIGSSWSLRSNDCRLPLCKAGVAVLPQSAPSVECASKPSIARSSVLRLRGLPYFATTLDVKAFFCEFELSDVHICRRNGRSTGEAYVVLHTPEAAQNAMLQLNKKYMASRYIELFEAAKADLAAVKRVLEDARLQGFVVRLRGLPYSATIADITSFLEGVQLADAEDAIIISHSADGRPTGEAHVELADEQALSLAMTRHKELIGSRYIEVFNSSKADKLAAQQQASTHPDSQPRSRGPPRAAVRLVGGSSLQHALGTPSTTTAFTSAPGLADQLADALCATYPLGLPLIGSYMPPACMPAYPSALGANLLSATNSAEAAAVAAGQRFLTSLLARAASNAELELQQQQQQMVVAVSGVDPGQAAVSCMSSAGMTAAAAAAPPCQGLPPGPVMMGPHGQTVYLATSQGMWPGPSSGMSLLPVCGAPGDAAAAMPGVAGMPGTALQPMLMPWEGSPPYMQPVMLPAAGMQQYAPPLYQWNTGPGVTVGMMPCSSAPAGFLTFSQPLIGG